MSSKSKAKGNAYERQIVKYLESLGYQAERAWGSNGKAFGEHEEVDLKAIIEGKELKLQLKRRRSIPQWIGLTEVVDASILREDRGDNYLILKLDRFLEILK